MNRMLGTASAACALVLATTAAATGAAAASHTAASHTAAAHTSAAHKAATSTLVGIRAAHHAGFDRVVLQFDGPLPKQRTAKWVSTVTDGASGKHVWVAGHAFLQRVFSPAAAHTASGASTVRSRITFPLPNVTQLVVNGDFENVLSVAIGVQRETTVHFSTLSSPTRVVMDFTTPYTWGQRHVYYLNTKRFANGTRPYTIGVWRPIIPPTIARQALERLWAGPTRGELANHLRFVRSDANGFKNLSVTDGIARVQLTGGCDSHGSTYTIANELMPTLRQFASVSWVKIYGPRGFTERPKGQVDSIPPCLEP